MTYRGGDVGDVRVHRVVGVARGVDGLVCRQHHGHGGEGAREVDHDGLPAVLGAVQVLLPAVATPRRQINL